MFIGLLGSSSKKTIYPKTAALFLFRWRFALEPHKRYRRSQITAQSTFRMRHRCRHSPSAADSACQQSRQAAHRFAARFPVVPCPADQPDFWRPGFRASRLRPALAGKTRRSARAARRARAGEGSRAETGHLANTFAVSPGIDRKGRGQRPGSSHVQGPRSSPHANGQAGQATKRGQGESHSQTQGCQRCSDCQPAQERGQSESRRKAEGGAPSGKRFP